MICHVYRSNKKADTYLYLLRRASSDVSPDNGSRDQVFGVVPEPLLNMLGKLEWVMEVDLSNRAQLAQVDCATLIKQLKKTGYFLQLPPAQYQGA